MDVLPHETFHRQADDLLVDVTVSLTQAILGTEIRVPTMDGGVMMKVPGGTQSGSTSGSEAKACRFCAGRARETSW